MKSYKDPGYDTLDKEVTAQLGLPDGLLSSIRLYGEKSNANQVSSAGAKTVYQIIGDTRDSILQKYKIDPYLSERNAAMGAGLLLKESLDRNNGDIRLAAAEYHGGTNQKNWGPKTVAYVDRVSKGVQELSGAPVQSGNTLQAQPATVQRPTGSRSLIAELGAQKDQNAIANVYAAYRDGAMSPEQQKTFEEAVNAGSIMLPRGAALKEQPKNEIPPQVIAAYNDGAMSPEQMATLDNAVAQGQYLLPQGVTLTKPQLVAEASMLDRLGRQAGLGARGVIQGAGQALDMLGGGLIAAGMRQIPGLENQQAPSVTATQLANAIGLPQPQTGIEKASVGALEAAVPGGGIVKAGQVLAKAASPVTAAVGGLLSAEAPVQIAAAMGAGAGQNIAEQLGGETAGQIAGALTGALAGGAGAARAGRVVQQAIPNTANQALVREAQAVNVPLMTSDVVPPTTFVTKTGQTMAERIPVAGTGPLRQQQEVARQNAVMDFLKQYGGDTVMRQDENIARNLQKTRSDALQKYTSSKEEVFNRLNDKGTVDVSRTTAKIDDEIAKLKSLNNPEVQPGITMLENFRDAIQNQSIVNINTQRKLLGDKITSPELAGSRSVLEKIPSRVYTELRKDMEDFVQTNGQPRDITRLKVANARLSELAGEVNNTRLRTALNTGDETPENVTALLFSSKKSDVERLYRNLSPEGKASARVAILQKATQQAGGLDNLSPQKFQTALQKLSNQTGVFFNQTQKEQADSLVRVLQATRRAGEFAANPPTGAQLSIPIGTAVLTDVLGSGGAALATGASIGALARVYESVPVRNLLLKINKARPAEKESLIRTIPAVIQAAQTSGKL